jgi:hypothetical protein
MYMAIKAVKYFVNPSTGTLHKVGGCCHSKVVPPNSRQYQLEDEAISHEQKYMKHCKLCFKTR